MRVDSRDSGARVVRDLAAYLARLLGVGIVYFLLAKIGFALASINPSATAIWPATGFALASALVWGFRVAPAVFIAAFAANATNAGSIYTSAAIAAGNTLEAVVAAWLINVWSHGRETFATPTDVAKFALVCLVPSTIISATFGVGSLTLGGYADPSAFAPIWITWWLGDVASALVFAPFVVLWAAGGLQSFARSELRETGAIVATATIIGAVAFSPLIAQTAYRDALGFLAILPLLWAALRRDQRATATVAVILACFAIWGTLAGGGPFAQDDLNASFCVLVMFLISISVPSLALSADVVTRRRSEENLRSSQTELDLTSRLLRAMTETLQESHAELEKKVEQRTRELSEALQQQTATADIFKVISRTTFDLQTLLDQLVESVARLCDAETVNIWRPSGDAYRIAASFGTPPEHKERLERLSIRPERGTCAGRALLEQKAVHIPDAQADPELPRVLSAGGNRTLLGVPLLREGSSVGVLVMTRSVVRPFTDRQIGLATTFADQAVIAIESVRLFGEIEEKGRQLAIANTAKSHFFAAANHDLRQPLHALGLFVEQLRSRVSAVERRRIVERMDAAVTGMNELFNALLDVSKIDLGLLAPAISEFPVARLLERIEGTFAGAASEKGLSLRIVPSGAWVRSDPILLERVLLNLTSNAVRYTARGRLVIGCRRRKGSVRIEVWDSGAGIPEDQQKKIFGDFYQLADSERNRQGGLGLGLAIVDRLCRLLDHPLELISTIGKGSCFAVMVPSGTAPAKSVEVPPLREIGRDAFKDKLVVVIDNDAMVLDSTGGLLRSWGCRVVAARSDGEAQAGISEHGRRPDLIISDYHLSDGTSGIEAIVRLREAFDAPIPAFLISGDTDQQRLREARAARYHLLHKPVRPMALRNMLRKLLGRLDVADASP